MLKCVDFFRPAISSKDEQVLSYLDHIEIFNHQIDDNYRVEFTFRENEFFYNNKLIVEVVVDDDEEDYQDGVVEIKGDTIEWKQGLNYLMKKSGNEIVKGEKSFFWIFKSFKSEDYIQDDEEDYNSYDEDPLSDRSLYYQSIEILQIFKNSFMSFIIPAIYNIEVKNFIEESDDDEYDSIEEEFPDSNKNF